MKKEGSPLKRAGVYYLWPNMFYLATMEQCRCLLTSDILTITKHSLYGKSCTISCNVTQKLARFGHLSRPWTLPAKPCIIYRMLHYELSTTSSGLGHIGFGTRPIPILVFTPALTQRNSMGTDDGKFVLSCEISHRTHIIDIFCVFL